MPVPPEYQRATDDFYAFLVDVRDTAGLATTHQTFTTVQGVLRVFRRRIEVREAIRFAGVLPPGLRALFVADWDPDEPRRAFESRQAMTDEVRALRPEHNFAPDSAIGDVASALWRHVDATALRRVLAELPAGTAEFWKAAPGGAGSEFRVPSSETGAG